MRKIILESGERYPVPSCEPIIYPPKNPDLFFSSEYDPFSTEKPAWLIPADTPSEETNRRVEESFRKAKQAAIEWLDLSYIHHKKRKTMQPTKDYFIVKVDSEFNDKIETNIVDQDGRKVELILDTSFQVLKHKKITGTVMVAPKKFSSEMKIVSKYKGSPGYTRERTHEEVASAVDWIPDWDVHRKKRYFRSLDNTATPIQPEYWTAKDIKVDIREGDKVWFHYLTIDDDNFITKDRDGLRMYKVPLSDIFCAERGSKMLMNCGYVFVEPFYGEGYEDIEVDGFSIKGRMKKVGDIEIVTETSETPKYLRGILRHKGNPVGDLERKDVRPGDQVIFLYNSEFENQINNETFYTMREWDIIAKVRKDGLILPVGDYVLAKVKRYAHSGIILLEKDDWDGRWDINEAEIIAKGKFGDVKCGDTVIFNSKSRFYVKLEEDNLALIRESDIYAKRI